MKTFTKAMSIAVVTGLITSFCAGAALADADAKQGCAEGQHKFEIVSSSTNYAHHDQSNHMVSGVNLLRCTICGEDGETSYSILEQHHMNSTQIDPFDTIITETTHRIGGYAGSKQTCTDCGYSSGVAGGLPAPTPHEYGEKRTIQEPTCTVPGKTSEVCEECGYEHIETIPVKKDAHKNLGHEAVSASTTAEGYDKTFCVDCGTVIELNKVPMIRTPEKPSTPAQVTLTKAEKKKANAVKKSRVSQVKLKKTAKRTVKVSWKKSSKYDSYTVYRKAGKGKWQMIKTNIKGNSAKISGQKKGKKYSYKVVGTKLIKGQIFTSKSAVKAIKI